MPQFDKLSTREQEVVKLLLQGKSNKLIAWSLGISDRTVEFHLKNIYAKFQVSSRVELILELGKVSGRLESKNLGYSQLLTPWKAPKMEVGSIHRWVESHLSEQPSL